MILAKQGYVFVLQNPLLSLLAKGKIALDARNFMEEATKDKRKGGRPKKGFSQRKTRRKKKKRNGDSIIRWIDKKHYGNFH